MSKQIQEENKEKQQELDSNIEESKIYLRLLMRIGLIMITSILIGFGIGLYIDSMYPTKGAIPLICLILGIGSGFYFTYRAINKVIK